MIYIRRHDKVTLNFFLYFLISTKSENIFFIFSVFNFSRSENIYFLFSGLGEIRKYFYFLISQKSKSYFQKIIFFQNIFSFEVRNNLKNMFSKNPSQNFFEKYFLTSTKSYFEIILFSQNMFSFEVRNILPKK